jgi:hypothetical protein
MRLLHEAQKYVATEREKFCVKDAEMLLIAALFFDDSAFASTIVRHLTILSDTEAESTKIR